MIHGRLISSSAGSGVTGTGDASGPSSSTDNAVARFNGTSGKLLKDSPNTTIGDDGMLSTGDPNGGAIPLVAASNPDDNYRAVNIAGEYRPELRLHATNEDADAKLWLDGNQAELYLKLNSDSEPTAPFSWDEHGAFVARSLSGELLNVYGVGSEEQIVVVGTAPDASSPTAAGLTGGGVSIACTTGGEGGVADGDPGGTGGTGGAFVSSAGTGGAGGAGVGSDGSGTGGVGGGYSISGGDGGVGGAGTDSAQGGDGGNGGAVSIQGGAGGAGGADGGSDPGVAGARGAVNIQTTGAGATTIGHSGGSGTITLNGSLTLPHIATGTDTYFLTLDSSNIVRKEAVGVPSSGSLSGISEITVVNGLVTSIAGAECPFVDITLSSGEVVRVGEIIPNRNAEAKEGVDLLALPVLVSQVTISEEKDETSFIKRLQLVVSLLGGGQTIINPFNLPNDGTHILMHKGDKLTVQFAPLPDTAVSAALLSEGYYIPTPKES